jgi:hypothetical protein
LLQGSIHSSVMRRAASMMLVVAAVATSGHSTAGDRELTESSDFRVRVQAALRLGKTPGASSRADLETGLRDAHPAVRVACAVALRDMGDSSSIPALQRAMSSESFATVKTSMSEAIEKLKKGGSAPSAAGGSKSLGNAKYVVQLGTMRNNTGQRADLDNMMRSAARAKAGTIKHAVVAEPTDATLLNQATASGVPVLLVDANLTRLSQSTGRDGGVIVSAQVDLSIRRVPQQTLKGMVSGNASASDDARNANKGITELQNRAVNGAIESAMTSVGSEIAALAK